MRNDDVDYRRAVAEDLRLDGQAAFLHFWLKILEVGPKRAQMAICLDRQPLA